MTVYVPRERRPVTVAVEKNSETPYVIVDSYGDKRERFVTLVEAQIAAVEINTGAE